MTARLFVLFFIFLINPLFGWNSFEILGGNGGVEVAREPGFLIGDMKPHEAREAFLGGKFNPLPDEAVSFGFDDRPLWLAVEISNKSGKTLFLSLKNNALEIVECFVYQQDSLLQRSVSGSMMPIDRKDVASIEPRFWLKKDHTPTVYLLRINSKTPLMVPMVIGTDGDIMLSQMPEYIIFAIFAGCFLSLFIYSAIFFVSTKEREYILYAGYLLAFFILMASTRGYFSPLFQWNPAMQNIIRGASLQATALLLVFFTLKLLNIQRYYPELYKISIAVAVICAVSFFVIGTGAAGHGIVIFAISILIALCAFLGFLSFAGGYAPSKYYLLALGGFFAGVLVSILMANGAIPCSMKSSSSPLIGSVWEMALLSIALWRKTRLLQEEKERALIRRESDSKILFLQSRYASMGETVGNIAHQWKQPLNAIGAIQTGIKASLLYQGDIAKEKLLASVNTSFELLQHLAETIDTFYGFLTQRDGREGSFRVAKELETIRKITEYSFENSNIKLIFDIQANPELQGNSNEFTHALLNLVLNARDAFEQKDTTSPIITIGVAGGEDGCMITVADNAGGISVEPTETIFEINYSSKEDGSGLGLFMTKNIIEQRFGGNIIVENRNGGAFFTIMLPYGECEQHFGDIAPLLKDKKSLAQIRELTNKVIELEGARNTLGKWADIFRRARWGIAVHMGISDFLELTNPAFDEMYGYTQNETQCLNMSELFVPEYLDMLSKAQKEAFEKGYAVFEAEHMRKDGRRFPVSIELIVVKGENGEALYRIANVWDITEQKKAHEELLFKEFALNKINDAVFLIDENSSFCYVNESACKSLGYTKEELLALGVVDIDPDISLEQWREIWSNLKKQKNFFMETKHLRKDGTIVPIEVSGNYLEYNGVEYSLAVTRDITERLQLEEQKDNERMKLFFERQLVGMAITSPEKGWLQTNEKLREMLGYTHEELAQLTWVELTHSDDLVADEEQFEKLLKDEIEDYMLQKRFIRKDGSIVYTNLAVSCVRKEDRSVDYVLALLEDITEQKRTHEALAAREQELRALAESSPGMMGAFYMRSDGSVCMPYASPNIYELFGVRPEDVRDDATTLLLRSHPDDAKRVEESIAESGRAMSVWHEEYRIIHPTKGERWMESNTMPQPHPNGGIVWYGYVHDVTKRKAAEQELQRALEFSEGVIGAIPDLLFEIARDGEYIGVWAQNAELLALQKELLLGKNFKDILPPDVVEVALKTLKEVDEKGFSIGNSYSLDLPHGKKWFELSASKKKISGTYMVLSREITERKQIEERLRRSEASLKEAQKMARIGSWELEIATDKLTWTDETYRIFEIDREEAADLHKIFYEITHPDDKAMVRKLYLESLETKLPYEMEHRIVMPDGRIKYVVETCTSQYDTDGNPILSIGTAQDITERKLMEKEIEASHNFLNQLVNSIHDPLFVKDREHRWVLLNDANIALTGIPREALIGKSDHDIFPKEQADVFWAKDEEVFDSREVNINEEYFTSASGVTHCIETIKSMFVSSSGEEYLVGTIRDITQRKTAEDALKKLNETLEERVAERTIQLEEALEFNESVINAIPDLLFEIDENGVYLNIWAQDEKLLAAQKEILLGKTVYAVMSQEAADTVMESIAEAKSQGLSFGKVIALELPRARSYFELSVSKKADTFLVLSRDVTERKKAEIELKDREEKFHELFKLSPAAISITSLERNIYLEANDSFLRYTEYTKEEIIGKNSAELGIFAYPQERVELFRRILEDGVVNDFRWHYKSKSGHIGYAAAYGSVITYSGEKCYMGHSYDMSAHHEVDGLQKERLALEEKLSKIAAALSKFRVD